MNNSTSTTEDKSHAVETTAKSLSEFIENFKARTYEMASDNVGSLAGRARRWVQRRKDDVSGGLLLNSSTAALISSFNTTANLEAITNSLKALFAKTSALPAVAPTSLSNSFDPVTRTISEEASVQLTQEFEALQNNVVYAQRDNLVGPVRSEWLDYNAAFKSGDVHAIETTLQTAYEAAGFVYNNSTSSPVCTHEKYTELQTKFGGATEAITPTRGPLVLVAPFSLHAAQIESVSAISNDAHRAPQPV